MDHKRNYRSLLHVFSKNRLIEMISIRCEVIFICSAFDLNAQKELKFYAIIKVLFKFSNLTNFFINFEHDACGNDQFRLNPIQNFDCNVQTVPRHTMVAVDNVESTKKCCFQQYMIIYMRLFFSHKHYIYYS